MIDKQIIQELPESFTRQDLLKAVIDKGYSMSKAGQIIEKGVISGELERIKPGAFRKMTAMH